MLKQHLSEKESVMKLISFTAGEGDDIVTRVRQQGAEAEATDAVSKLLSKTDERKRTWERAWEEREQALIRKLETCQIMIEKSQINRDLELLIKEIETRKKNVGSSYELIQRDLHNFTSISENMNVCFQSSSSFHQ
jgi:hypothetical protein